MRQSKLFSKTFKESPGDEQSINAKLLIRGGFLNKEMAGVYSFLPLGLRVIRKIEKIIREEINETLSAQEILMSALHPLENYEKTGREKIDVLFYTELVSKRKLVLGISHEEIIVPLVKKHVSSYKDLPFYVYQIQNKFRNELRAKSGILRGREFLMKDLYSFHTDEKDLNDYYEKSKEAYRNIFEKSGIGDKTYITFADGGTFSKYSHEFQMITEAGEDLIYLCQSCKVAVNEEIIEECPNCPQCGGDKLIKKKAVEVGNIFKLKDKFSNSFGLTFKNEKGEEKLIQMGCYGIGLGRLLGSVVEVYHDQKGIIWPSELAPFFAHLIQIGDDPSVKKACEKLYSESEEEILYDDRKDVSPGEKFADADLMGIPFRLVMSKKTLEKDSFEVKRRNEEKVEFVKIKEINNFLKEKHAS